MTISGVGTTDITTDDAHIEIKNWGRFQEVPGQLAKYQQAVKRPQSHVYFFGPEPPKQRYEQIHELMEAANIRMFSFDAEDEVREHGRHLSEERALFNAFRDARLAPETGRVLKPKDAQQAFIDWADVETRRKVADVRKFLDAHFGVLNENGHKDSLLKKTVRGWKDWALVPAPNNPGMAEPADNIDGAAHP